MSARLAGWLAWSLCASVMVLTALDLLLAFLGRSADLPEFLTWQAKVGPAVSLAGAAVLGALIASRRPQNPYGWLWLGFGGGFALSGFAGSYATHAVIVDPGSLPAPRTILMLGLGWTAASVILPFLMLLFPTGRLPSRRWKFLAWPIVAVGAVAMILGPLVPGESGIAPIASPFAIGGVVGNAISTAVPIGTVFILAAEVPAALSLVIRYRRASGVERRQIKWFALAAVLVGVLVAVDLLGLDSPFSYTVWNLFFSASLLGLYAAVGVAILRHRLYDIDILINRTLVYVTLTATLVLSYLGGVVVLQALFRSLAGQGSQLAVVASTLAIAALFNPLRSRVQAFVDRLFYRRKYDAAKTLESFSARLRDETDLETLSIDLVAVVRDTVQPEHASLWLRPPGQIRKGESLGEMRENTGRGVS